MNIKKPLVQVSIDTQTIDEGIKQARIAIESGADWIEVGTPLITFEGMKSIDALVSLTNTQEVLVDYKALDGVSQYFMETGKRGASIATVMAITNDFSIKKAVEAGNESNVKVMVDMFSYPMDKIAERASQMQDIGADYLLIHLGIDEFRAPNGSKNPLNGLDEVVASVNIPVAVVVFTLEEALNAISRGAQIIVVGTPIIELSNAEQELRLFIEKIKT